MWSNDKLLHQFSEPILSIIELNREVLLHFQFIKIPKIFLPLSIREKYCNKIP
uniref:Uncharacterized protein n=1 Tax=Rhizophora mucronata TaxID=61149 RepID=A0A2P2QL06_RHIMU